MITASDIRDRERAFFRDAALSSARILEPVLRRLADRLAEIMYEAQPLSRIDRAFVDDYCADIHAVFAGDSDDK